MASVSTVTKIDTLLSASLETQKLFPVCSVNMQVLSYFGFYHTNGVNQQTADKNEAYIVCLPSACTATWLRTTVSSPEGAHVDYH